MLPYIAAPWILWVLMSYGSNGDFHGVWEGQEMTSWENSAEQTLANQPSEMETLCSSGLQTPEFYTLR
jgi:hypothetical protein